MCGIIKSFCLSWKEDACSAFPKMGQVVEEVNHIDDRGGEAAKFVKDTSGVGWEGWRRMGLRLVIPKTLSHRHSPFHPDRRLFSLGTFLAPPQKEESPLPPPPLLP